MSELRIENDIVITCFKIPTVFQRYLSKFMKLRGVNSDYLHYVNPIIFQHGEVSPRLHIGHSTFNIFNILQNKGGIKVKREC